MVGRELTRTNKAMADQFPCPAMPSSEKAGENLQRVSECALARVGTRLVRSKPVAEADQQLLWPAACIDKVFQMGICFYLIGVIALDL